MPSLGETNEQIAKRRRIEYARVVHRNEGGHASVSEAVFLREIGLPIGEQVREPHTAVSADLAERQLVAFEQRDEVRPRDIQEIGGLLRCELGMDRDNGDRVAIGRNNRKQAL